MSERTRVVVGSSTDGDYCFLLPITMLFWRDLVGHEPRAYLVGDEAEWEGSPRLRACLGALRLHGVRHAHVGRLPGYQDATLAQNLRQHAAADPEIADGDWVVPADADLWPLRRAFYHQHAGRPERAACYYSNGDHFQGKEDVLGRASRGLRSQTIPTCHAALRAADWRRMYDLVPDRIAESVRRSLDRWLLPRVVGKDPGEAAFMTWMSDQQMMTEVLCRQPWFPGEALMIERRGHPPVDRLDRGHLADWQAPYDAERWTDAHVHKAPSGAAHWPLLLRVVEAALPQHASWARAYRGEYAAAEAAP